MKKYKVILAFAGAILLLAQTGCKITDQDRILRIHKYINQSGVEVAMVGEASPYIPDSLVIPNGETYECSLLYAGMMDGEYDSTFPYSIGNPNDESTFIPIKVYYNKNVCVSYTCKDKGKNPIGINRGSYTKEVTESNDLTTLIYTYIFTPEDYQNAINAQNKL